MVNCFSFERREIFLFTDNVSEYSIDITGNVGKRIKNNKIERKEVQVCE